MGAQKIAHSTEEKDLGVVINQSLSPSHHIATCVSRANRIVGLRTDTTREFFFKRKLINYTKNELQGINILKLRLPNGFKCCLNFFIVGMGTNVK